MPICAPGDQLSHTYLVTKYPKGFAWWHTVPLYVLGDKVSGDEKSQYHIKKTNSLSIVVYGCNYLNVCVI